MELHSVQSATVSSIPPRGLFGKPFLYGQTITIKVLTNKRTSPVSISLKFHGFKAQTSGAVDSSYILPIEHRPKINTTEANNIPLINLSPLKSLKDDSNINDLSRLVEEIGYACANWGFFQVINHGVPSESREKIELASRKFFALPKEEKQKVSRDEVNPYGYYDTEYTKNVRDWKEIFEVTVQNPTIVPASPDPGDMEIKHLINQWPENLPELREACEEHAAEMEKLAIKLLELIALSLGLQKDRLNEFYEDQLSRIRLNYYPPCPAPDLALGIGRHKDAGALTILAQDDVCGLQVKRKTDGDWILVKPISHAYIVNLGDIIQVWSNGRYESIEHRVALNSNKERFSIPYFYNPAHYTWVEPLEELINDQNPAKYKGYNYGKFFAARNQSNFKKLKFENIQIHDLRI